MTYPPKYLYTQFSAFMALALGLVSSLTAEIRVINLADALRLADERNAQLALSLERARQAAIESQQSWLQWLPTS